MNNIIIAMPERLGDTLFRTPLLRLLKTIFPHVNIDVIASTNLSFEVLSHSPYIRKLFLQPRIEQVEELKNNYDLVIDVSDSEYVGSLIKEFNGEHINYVDNPGLNMHSAEKSLQFFAKLFQYDLNNFTRQYDIYPQQENFTHIEKMLTLNNIGMKNKILIGFHMGCHSLAKKRTRLWNKFSHPKAWPLKKFIGLTMKLQKYNSSVRIVLTGTEEEAKLGVMFCEKFPNSINLINQISVLDLAALMSYLQLFISNDTGSMHVACASNVNMIALFGKSNPVVTGPYPKSSSRVILFKPAIADITIDKVFLAVCKHVNARKIK
jgi:ADP-heptose:LPS heptosyltransferase